MNKLKIIAVFFLAASIISCGNIKGNQSDDKLTVDKENNESKNEKADIKPEYLTYETFKEKIWDFEANPQEFVYKGDTPCVIDFYADWCKPCRLVAPIMDKLAVDYDGKVKIYKIDTDKEKKLAGVFGIRSIPSVMFVPMEGRPSMQAGALPESEYVRIIEEVVLNNKK